MDFLLNIALYLISMTIEYFHLTIQALLVNNAVEISEFILCYNHFLLAIMG